MDQCHHDLVIHRAPSAQGVQGDQGGQGGQASHGAPKNIFQVDAESVNPFGNTTIDQGGQLAGNITSIDEQGAAN